MSWQPDDVIDTRNYIVQLDTNSLHLFAWVSCPVVDTEVKNDSAYESLQTRK